VWHDERCDMRTLTLVVFSMARLTANIEDRLVIEPKLPA
jgi:hypothetical protein